MHTLARGSENVKKLLGALGGPVPKEAESRSLASLQKIAQERHHQERKHREELAELQAQAQAPLLALIHKDEKAAASVAKLRDLQVLIPPPPECPPVPSFVMESRYQADSVFVVRTPPFDTGFADAFGSADSWVDTPEQGICGFKIGQGAHDRAANGVAAWFWSTADNPLTRSTAFLSFCFNWSDFSVVQPAYNEASVNLWVWGDQENSWVA